MSTNKKIPNELQLVGDHTNSLEAVRSDDTTGQLGQPASMVDAAAAAVERARKTNDEAHLEAARLMSRLSIFLEVRMSTLENLARINPKHANFFNELMQHTKAASDAADRTFETLDELAEVQDVEARLRMGGVR